MIASITICIPGPGVIFTLTNAFRYMLFSTLAGIFGVAIGMFIISVIAATSVGIIIKTTPALYSALKVIGAVYLIYIGVKIFRSSSIKEISNSEKQPLKNEKATLFKRGVYVSLTNPKPILFFIALFPQFIQSNNPFILEFLKLSVSFCFLVCLIHWIYAMCANTVKVKIINSPHGLRTINQIGGSCFILFAIMLLFSLTGVTFS